MATLLKTGGATVAMWAHADVLDDLVGIVEDRSDSLTDGQVRALTQLLYESMYESTSRGAM